MVGGMPILRCDDQIIGAACHQAVCDGDDRIAFRNRQVAAGAEAVLDVDEQ